MKKSFLLIIFIVISLLSVNIVSSSDELGIDLVHLWNLQSNGADEGLGNESRLNESNVVGYVAGKDRKGADLEDTGDVATASLLTNSTMTNLNSLRSFGLWLKPESLASDDVVISISDGINDENAMQIIHDGSQLELRYKNSAKGMSTC
jgi:hypothetical protein